MEGEPRDKNQKIEILEKELNEIKRAIGILHKFHPVLDVSVDINNIWEKWGRGHGVNDSFDKAKLKEELLNYLKGKVKEINRQINEK